MERVTVDQWKDIFTETMLICKNGIKYLKKDCLYRELRVFKN